MLLLYKNADSMPDFILTMEEAQKKAKRAELPILDIELAMYAATSVLHSAANKKETDEWEGRNTNKKTWTEWKQAYWAAYAQGINCQRAGATDEPFTTRAANNIMPAATTDVIDALVGSLDNLALAPTSNKNALKQLTAANLALTTTVSTLTIANKQLTKIVARFNLPPNIHGGYVVVTHSQSHLGQLLMDTWIQDHAQQRDLRCSAQASRSRCINNSRRH